MKKVSHSCIAILILVLTSVPVVISDEPSDKVSPDTISNLVEVVPAPYEKALRNPVKGFTSHGIYDHEWATMAQTYFGSLSLKIGFSV